MVKATAPKSRADNSCHFFMFGLHVDCKQLESVVLSAFVRRPCAIAKVRIKDQTVYSLSHSNNGRKAHRPHRAAGVPLAHSSSNPKSQILCKHVVEGLFGFPNADPRSGKVNQLWGWEAASRSESIDDEDEDKDES